MIRQVIDSETCEIVLLGPDILYKTIKNIVLIQKKIRTAKSRQKKYADKRKILLDFKARDLVFP